jgi:hypothetical protein
VSAVQEIKSAIQRLSHDQMRTIQSWLNEMLEDDWHSQMNSKLPSNVASATLPKAAFAIGTRPSTEIYR